MSDLGVVLVVVGVALMVAEAHLPSHGFLATRAVATP
jgi:membrane-bound ClpP family serine protease